MMTFDEKGHVYPYAVIEMTMGEFKQVFVEGMEDKTHRKQLFTNYLRFTEAFQAALGIPFFQWVNGSFTTKKLLPGDIDVVSFIEYDQFARKLAVLDRFHSIGKGSYDTDLHFAATCKWNHRFYQRAVSDEAYWKDVFGFSKPDESDVRYPKGIIKIKF
jgi:hypothetical protein